MSEVKISSGIFGFVSPVHQVPHQHAGEMWDGEAFYSPMITSQFFTKPAPLGCAPHYSVSVVLFLLDQRKAIGDMTWLFPFPQDSWALANDFP